MEHFLSRGKDVRTPAGNCAESCQKYEEERWNRVVEQFARRAIFLKRSESFLSFGFPSIMDIGAIGHGQSPVICSLP